MIEDTTPYANGVFEQPWWLNAVAPGQWEEVILEERGEVVGRWPICFKDKSHKKVVMPPLTQTCGIWIKKMEFGRGNEGMGRVKELIDEFEKKINGVKSIDVEIDASISYFLPFYWNGFVINPKISYRISELKNLDLIYENFNKTVKKNIKSAEKKVIISETISVENLYEMLEKTFKIQGRNCPYSKELISRIINTCEKHRSGKMFTAIGKDGIIHASSYFIYDQNRCYYLISGSDPEYRTNGAQTLILWKAIQFASKVSKEFDFEGSMVEGIENFFRRFGGKPVIYYEIRRQSWLDEIKTVSKPHIKKIIGYKI